MIREIGGTILKTTHLRSVLPSSIRHIHTYVLCIQCTFLPIISFEEIFGAKPNNYVIYTHSLPSFPPICGVYFQVPLGTYIHIYYVYNSLPSFPLKKCLEPNQIYITMLHYVIYTHSLPSFPLKKWLEPNPNIHIYMYTYTLLPIIFSF